VSLAASPALRVVLTIALFVLFMPGLVTFVIALSMSWDEPSAYYRWGSFTHMMGLGYKVGLPAAAVTGACVALLTFFLHSRFSLYAAAALIGAASVVASAIIRNGVQENYAGVAVAGVLGALAALGCTVLAHIFGLRAPAEATAS